MKEKQMNEAAEREPSRLRVQKVEYWEGQPGFGVKYNFKAIRKLYKKLNIPPEYFNPAELPLESAKYFPTFSMRATGKTTDVLLLGMCFNALYDTEIIYVRQIEEMILPKVTKDLFSVITDPEYDYINVLTDGRYNGICYKARRWYYCNVDDQGKVIETAPHHFMFMCSVANANALKSGFNTNGRGDFIIFDEFINPVYMPDEWVQFCQLVKTIIRKRYSPIVFMLANTIDKESTYWHELEIYDEVKAMLPGETINKTTSGGSSVCVTYVSPSLQKAKKLQKFNRLFFGFKNKKLGSITGADWDIKPKPHIPESTYSEVFPIIDNLYIYDHEKYVRLEIVQHTELGICVFVHWATKVYDDSIILTTEDITDRRFKYGLGPRNLQLLLAKLIASNKFYYASDDVGAFVSHYVNSIPPTM